MSVSRLWDGEQAPSRQEQYPPMLTTPSPLVELVGVASYRHDTRPERLDLRLEDRSQTIKLGPDPWRQFLRRDLTAGWNLTHPNTIVHCR